VQGRKVFAGASEGELNSAAGSQICSVDTVPALTDGSDDRCHEPVIEHTIVFISDPFDERQVGVVKLVYALFERTAGKIGNNLKSGRYRADLQDAQTPHEIANFAFADDIPFRNRSF
jgi:hypothetical protein